jgi:hypothetical protein
MKNRAAQHNSKAIVKNFITSFHIRYVDYGNSSYCAQSDVENKWLHPLTQFHDKKYIKANSIAENHCYGPVTYT